MKTAIVAALAATAVNASALRDLAAVPIGESTHYNDTAGVWKIVWKVVADECTVDPEPQCKASSWTLCNFTNFTDTNYWCAGPDKECKTDSVGCNDVEKFPTDDECEEVDNKCGYSYCGTSPVQDDCQCSDEDACVRVKFVNNGTGGACLAAFLVSVAALAGLAVLI